MDSKTEKHHVEDNHQWRRYRSERHEPLSRNEATAATAVPVTSNFSTATIVKVWPLLDPLLWRTPAPSDGSHKKTVNVNENVDETPNWMVSNVGAAPIEGSDVACVEKGGWKEHGAAPLPAAVQSPNPHVTLVSHDGQVSPSPADVGVRSTSSSNFSTMSFALEPLLQLQCLEQIMQYRVKGVRLWSAWYVVSSSVWLLAVPILRQSHPVLLALVMACWFTIGIGAGQRIDRNLLCMLLRHFETWYLLFHLAVMCVSAIYATADTESSVFLISYWSGIMLLSVYALIMDSFAGMSNASRLILIGAGLVSYANMLIRENIHHEMEPVPVCLVFCTDSRRLSLLGLMQLLFFFGRYVWTAVKVIRGQPQFAVLRVPLQCVLIGHASMEQPSFIDAAAVRTTSYFQCRPPKEPAASEADLEAVVGRDIPCSASTATATVLAASDSSTSTNYELQPIVGSGNCASLAVVPATQSPLNSRDVVKRARAVPAPPAPSLGLIRVETELSPQAFGFDLLTTNARGSFANNLETTNLAKPYVHHHEFPFRPVVSWQPLQTLTRHKLYQGFVCCFLILSVIIQSVAWIRTADGIAPSWLLLIGALVVACCELSRFDRTMVAVLLHRFEFYIVVLSGAQYVIFGIASETYHYSLSVLIPPYASLTLFHVLICLGDAAPSYPRRFRLFCVAAYIVNAFQIFIFAQVTFMYYPYEVCMFFCSTTSVLALSGLFTAVAFSIKYFFNLLRDGTHCILLSTKIAFSVQKDVPIMMPNESASVTRDDSQSSAAQNTSDCEVPRVVAVDSHMTDRPDPKSDGGAHRHSYCSSITAPAAAAPSHRRSARWATAFSRHPSRITEATLDSRSQELAIGIAAYAMPAAAAHVQPGVSHIRSADTSKNRIYRFPPAMSPTQLQRRMRKAQSVRFVGAPSNALTRLPSDSVYMERRDEPNLSISDLLHDYPDSQGSLIAAQDIATYTGASVNDADAPTLSRGSSKSVVDCKTAVEITHDSTTSTSHAAGIYGCSCGDENILNEACSSIYIHVRH